MLHVPLAFSLSYVLHKMLYIEPFHHEYSQSNKTESLLHIRDENYFGSAKFALLNHKIFLSVSAETKYRFHENYQDRTIY